MDESLIQNLESIRRAVTKKDFDGIYVIDGMEGAGKSTIAQQTMKVLYPDLSVEDIVFTGEQFLQKVEDAKPYTGIIWDEAGSAAGTTEAMGKLQNTIRKKLQVIREKNLFICLVIPYIFGMQTYFAVSRTRFLIHIYTKGFKRGYYSFYNYPRKKQLYFKGKKSYHQYVVQPDFRGNFSNGYVIDEQEYRKRKRELSEQEAEKEDTVGQTIKKIVFNLTELPCDACKYKLNQREIGMRVDRTQAQISRILRSPR